MVFYEELRLPMLGHFLNLFSYITLCKHWFKLMRVFSTMYIKNMGQNASKYNKDFRIKFDAVQ